MTVWSAGKIFIYGRNGNQLMMAFFISVGCTASPEPPVTLVMKEQRWYVASEMVTQLLNDSEEVLCLNFTSFISTGSNHIDGYVEYFKVNGSNGKNRSTVKHNFRSPRTLRSSHSSGFESSTT